MRDAFVTSGLLQLTVAVWLGWPLVAFVTGAERVGPLRDMRRTLQCHLDNIFMGVIQLAIAAVHPAIPAVAGWLLIAGSWINPQLFLVSAISKRSLELRWVRAVSALSFLALSVAYPWLVVAWLRR